MIKDKSLYMALIVTFGIVNIIGSYYDWFYSQITIWCYTIGLWLLAIIFIYELQKNI